MKQLSLLPLLIAAACYVPHAHAAGGTGAARSDLAQHSHISAEMALLAALGMMGLLVRRQPSETFKAQP